MPADNKMDITKKPCRPIVIAYVTESYQMGGVEKATATYIAHINRARFTPQLICREMTAIDPLAQEALACGARVVRTELLQEHNMRALPAAIIGIYRIFKQLSPDIVHVQVLGGDGARYIALAARLAGIPVVVSIHNVVMESDHARKSLFNKFTERAVYCYITVSENNRKLQIEQLGRDPDHIRVIHNAINIDDFDPLTDGAPVRRELNISAHAPLIGTIARLSPQKGIDVFLKMAAALLKTHPQARFLVVGDGEVRETYLALQREMGLEHAVIFAGQRTDMAVCLAAMNVFVLTSRFEPFGLVLAEAMAMKKPVVASRVGGIPEVVIEGKTGYLAASGDADEFSAYVARYLQDIELSIVHGEAGRLHVQANFSVDGMMEHLEEIYMECLHKRGRR